MFRKRLQELREDESAVSPVLGVALLIAITVTLVAVIGVVVLGVGPTNAGAPQANLVFETNTNTVEMSHQGGDKLAAENLRIRVEHDGGGSSTIDEDPITSEMVAGDTRTVATNAEDGDVVKIVWEAPNGDEAQVIASYEV